MKTIQCTRQFISLCLAISVGFLIAPKIFAHCDSLDGPVVKAAQRALTEGNVRLALIWVQQNHEPEIKRVFEKTLSVRKLGPEAKELADLYFFETLVRLHRAGEGEPYTGLKPGRDLGPAISLGDQALVTGELEPVRNLLSTEMKEGLHERFTETMSRKKFAPNDVTAGRAYVQAYVRYIHYVDGLYQAAIGAGQHHPGESAEAHADDSRHNGKP